MSELSKCYLKFLNMQIHTPFKVFIFVYFKNDYLEFFRFFVLPVGPDSLLV